MSSSNTHIIGEGLSAINIHDYEHGTNVPSAVRCSWRPITPWFIKSAGGGSDQRLPRSPIMGWALRPALYFPWYLDMCLPHNYFGCSEINKVHVVIICSIVTQQHAHQLLVWANSSAGSLFDVSFISLSLSHLELGSIEDNLFLIIGHSVISHGSAITSHEQIASWMVSQVWQIP